MIALAARSATGSTFSCGTPDLIHIAASSLGPFAVIVSRSGLLGAIRLTGLLQVCEQCATQEELNVAQTQVTCPGCLRTFFVPYQWKACRRRYCCDACRQRARRKDRRESEALAEQRARIRDHPVDHDLHVGGNDCR
jgi:hypothetical protein